jgi:ParB family chromosome partitioning protein
MSGALVVDGTERGRIVRVCAEPTCPVHFADRCAPNPEQTAKERAQRRKELERQKLEATVRHRALVEGTASEVTHPQVQQAIARMLRQPDEGALSKLLIAVILLECTDRAPTNDPDVLIVTAKRHRVDVDKLRKAVEQEFTAKRAKLAAKQKKAAKKTTAKIAM